MVSEEHLNAIHESVEEIGKTETADKFRITLESLERYLRLYKLRQRADKLEEEIVGQPNILILDIETAPLTAHLFGIWHQNINLEFLVSDWHMISWVAKFLHDDKVYSDVITSEEAIAEDDKRICMSIHKLLDMADVVVAHNGKKFDIKRLNTRFLINGLFPPTPYQQIDTLEVAKKTFAFSSNKLDQINRQLGIERKIETKAALWVGCMKGDQASLDEMVRYNERDVLILQETYLRLRPWMFSHPNLSVYTKNDTPTCPRCNSTDVVEVPDADYATGVSKFHVFRCNKCGGYARSRQNQNGRKKNQSLLTSIVR